MNRTYKTLMIAGMSALTLGATAAATSTPANAQHFRGGGGFHHGGYGGYGYHRGYGGAGIGLGIAAGALAAGAAANAYPYDDGPYYGQPYYAPYGYRY